MSSKNKKLTTKAVRFLTGFVVGFGVGLGVGFSFMNSEEYFQDIKKEEPVSGPPKLRIVK